MTDLEQKLQNCLLDAVEASTLPPECYSNEKIFEIEKRAFFYNQWIPIGHVNHLKKPGDFFTKEVANVPIIVIRDKKYDPSFRDKRSNHFTESNHINLAIYIKRLFNNEPVNDIKFNENVI